MREINITSQEQWDLLPEKFEEFTVLKINCEYIVIKSNPGNSRAVLWGYSSADAFLCATIIVLSAFPIIGKLLDNSHLIYKYDNKNRPRQKDESAKITEFNEIITPSFEQWLERGYVVTDGINQKLVNQKTIGELSVFETTDFFEKEKYVVVKKGNIFSHGKTYEEAKESLKYKNSNRDTSEYELWKLKDRKSLEELISAYRAITGACEFGTRYFCEGRELKDTYSVEDVIIMTQMQYGHEQFKNFGWSK